MSDPVINVRGLTKRFGDRTVVRDLDLKVDRGAIYGFLGPNGSGKTTSIRMVCGLLRPDAGEGQCLGFDVRRESQIIKERVGYMTQRFSLYEDLSIRENLQFIARMYAVRPHKERVDAALEELGLTARASQLAGKLSGGWKQRLALAACMIHDPDLLLLDEPTAGVDPKARRDFWDQIRSFAARGVTTLVSTHYMDEAVQCDRIAFISYGRKLIDEETANVPGKIGLAAARMEGDGIDEAHEALQRDPNVDLVVRFGTALHICAQDRETLTAALAPYAARPGMQATEIPLGLEESFIHLMAQSEDNFQ